MNAITEFEQRVAALSDESSIVRRELLLDSILADASRKVRVARERAHYRAKLRVLLSELDTLGMADDELVRRVAIERIVNRPIS